jgi:hypothetical protein
MTDPYTQRPMERALAVTAIGFDGLHGSRADGGTVFRLTIPTGPAVGGEESR